MVFKKIKDAFASNDEKYEVLYHKYSKLRLENKNLKQENKDNLSSQRSEINSTIAHALIKLYDSVETAKNDSFKVKATDTELQRLLIDVNKVEKDMKKLMNEFSIEQVSPQERFFDQNLHQVASYTNSEGMKEGLILKTVKKGFKLNGKIIQKPKVVVTK